MHGFVIWPNDYRAAQQRAGVLSPTPVAGLADVSDAVLACCALALAGDFPLAIGTRFQAQEMIGRTRIFTRAELIGWRGLLGRGVDVDARWRWARAVVQRFLSDLPGAAVIPVSPVDS